MKFFRQILTGRLLCAFMALHLLNISIDTPDTAVNGNSEDLTYNKQESILEFLLEKVLLQDNMIAEYDECDTDDSLAKKMAFSVDFFIIPAHPTFNPSFSGDVRKDIFHNIPAFKGLLTEIHSPPPEV
ncbi:MAG: hypothetical protein ACO1N9_01490 [Flavobacterium sp.]